MTENRPLRVFLADDHPLIRLGLQLGLDQAKDLILIGEADDGFSAVDKIQADPPDVALIDVNMPGLSGISAIKILRNALPLMKILVISTYSDEKYIQEAMDAGADGYVLKCVGMDELVKIIKAFYNEKPVLSPYLINLTLGYSDGAKKGTGDQAPCLTSREKEVLRCIAEAKENKEIAEMLYVSTETVKSHVKNLFKKLNVKNRMEAAKVAKDRRLLV
jgi:DNA-binding NarL/FixJ family response regulator